MVVVDPEPYSLINKIRFIVPDKVQHIATDLPLFHWGKHLHETFVSDIAIAVALVAPFLKFFSGQVMYANTQSNLIDT